MLKKVIGFLWLLVLSTTAGWSEGVLNQEFTRAEVLATKREIVANNMHLQADEEKRFWQLYDGYQIDMNKINEERSNLIVKFGINYNNMTDELAGDLLSKVLAMDRKKVSLRKEWLDRMRTATHPSTAARFYQIENKLDAIVAYEAAQQIPLVKSPAKK